MGQDCCTKEKLLQTALELMWENSYGSVSVDDICDRAGVRKGSFYHFFPSKSDLTVAVLEMNWEKIRAKMDEAFSAQWSPLERFDRFATGTYEAQKEKKSRCGKACGCPNISVGLELSTQDEKIRQAVQRIFDRKHRYFESTLHDAEREGSIPPGDHSAKAKEIQSLVLGLLVQVKIYNDPEILANLKTTLRDLIGADKQSAVGAA